MMSIATNCLPGVAAAQSVQFGSLLLLQLSCRAVLLTDVMLNLKWSDQDKSVWSNNRVNIVESTGAAAGYVLHWCVEQ